MRGVSVLVGAALASCSASTDTDEVRLGPVVFEVPAQWERTNHEATGSRSAMWAPLADENGRKESITVIRSAAHVTPDRLTSDGVASLLAGAQGSLPGARVSPATPVQTRRGYTGAKIDVSFLSGDNGTRYRRVHAVLVEPDASSVVHVLYTAARPDDKLTAFYTVLESIHHGGG